MGVVPMLVAVALTGAGSMPSPAPAARMYSGRHRTLPYPLARRLSTQLGNAPVVRYSLKMSSETRWYQSDRRIGTASRSASCKAVSSVWFLARVSYGRGRCEDGWMTSGPRMASSEYARKCE
ncbi:hypothetical protein MPH_07474 [Macrophomina phaseolina MS6]|uniref:Secreted protein n=1 Tax=Macrophomina phaseolina (strain MS6) TaxID=1126212 RepID=K2QZC8_MACPH|nr:hypothetical protein MPH_07474 [Macrophomina phaseolina MS6]